MKSNKIIICCALTGAGTQKSAAPSLPVTPEEIAEDVVRVGRAGASYVHLHARDPKNPAVPINDTAVYRDILDAVREKCKEADLDMVINMTTGLAFKNDESRYAHARELLPELMSLDIGSFNYNDKFLYSNPPDFLREACKMALEYDIKPEIEVFDTGHIRSAETFIKEGILKTPCHFQFVLGAGGAMDGTIENLIFLKNMLPEGSTWSATGIGITHVPILYASIAAGCDVLRVGLEDNIYYARGVKATNEMLVKRAVEAAKLAGREIANAAETREILGITRKCL